MMTKSRTFLFAVFISLVSLAINAGCIPPAPDIPEEELYVLPESHPDNIDPLKLRFFQEPFRNMDGEMVQIERFVGTPIIILMFPNFLTDDGRRSLLGLEALHRSRPGQFISIIIPQEDRETIEPAVQQKPDNMTILFRPGDNDNFSLIDRYSDFFWDPELIAADFPLDPPSKHHTSPFYWIVDETGAIREKLIDYSDSRGVGVVEVEQVLNALLGPPPEIPPGMEPVQPSVADGGNEIDPEIVEDPE